MQQQVSTVLDAHAISSGTTWELSDSPVRLDVALDACCLAGQRLILAQCALPVYAHQGCYSSTICRLQGRATPGAMAN
jgi:hypothetical protein